MRMKQKLMSLALVLAMALTLLPTMAFAVAHDATPETGACKDAQYNEVKGQAATCAQDGWSDYYTCSVCSNPFEDSAGETPITDLEAWKSNDGKLAKEDVAHTMNWTTKDETGHAGNCSVCSNNEVTLTAHTFDKTAATPTGKCTVCEYECLHTGETGATCSVCGKALSSTSTTATVTLTAISYDKTTKKLTATVSYDSDTGDAPASITVKATTKLDETVSAAESDVVLTKDQAPVTAMATTATATYSGTYAAQTAAGTYTISAVYGGVTKTAEYTVDGTENPAISNVTYDYNTGALTWTGTNIPATTGNAGEYFWIRTYDVAADSFISSSGVEAAESGTTAPQIAVTKNGTTYSCTYKPVTLAAGNYEVVVQYPNGGPALGSYPFTVAAPVVTPPPSTGIPNAGTVTDASSAQSAVNTLKNTSTDTIKANLESGDAAVENYAALEAAVVKATGLTVSVEPDRSTPSAAAAVTVTGAAFNAAPNAKAVALEVSGASRSYSLGRKYDATDAVAFNMTLTGVSNASKLDVPVVIQMPVPSGISSKRLVVLHYHGSSSTPEVLTHKITGKTLSFVVTGFSDFVIAETASSTTTSGGSSSGGGSASSGNISRPVVVTPPTTTTTPAGIFTDVPASHSFASQITWARDNNIMGGYADGSFRPNATTNRQQLWMVLARLAGEAPADMAAARDWAISAGISDGSAPDGSMSRQQLVTMLYRYAQSKEQSTEGTADLSTYPDASAVASYASEALAWAVGNGIVTGTSDGRLNPEGTATRGQFAVMLYRFSHLS